MASDDKWTTVGAALRGDLTRVRPARTAGAGEPRPRTVRGRARALPSLDEILRVRGRGDLASGDGTEGALAFGRIQARMAKRLGLVADELRGEIRVNNGVAVEFRVTPELRERRAKLAPGARRRMPTPRSLPDAGTERQSPLTRGAPPSAEELARLSAEYAKYTLVERHEAGHALVAHALGMHVYRTSVVDRQHGDTRISDANERGEDVDERWLAVTYAGWRAERSHVNWDDSFEALWDGQHDHERIEERVASLELGPKDEVALRARVIARVDRIIECNQPKLDELTQALCVDRTVAGSRLRGLLKGGIFQ